MSQETGHELGWNDQIENDGGDYILLAEGDYPFEVLKFERGRYKGGEKLPACNMAKLSIEIDGKTTVTHNLYLHSRTEGLLCAFFKAIGARKHGERVSMDWNKVVGEKGRCKVGVRTYKDKQYNEIKKFYDPEESQQETPPSGDQPF